MSDCFIRYAGCDSAFAQQLHRDLQAAGVRCWFAPEDVQVGLNPCERTGPALRLQDRLVLVLSQEGLRRRWLAQELAGLMAEERRRDCTIVLPLRLDVDLVVLPGALARRSCVDFCGWFEPGRYRAGLSELLSELEAEGAARAR